MRALACVVVVWTLVACSKPSEPSGPAAAGAQAPDASPVTAAATGGTATAPQDAGPAASDAGTAVSDAGPASPADAGTASPAADTELPAMCRTIASRYESIQKAAPLECKVDADCSCHLVLTQDRVLAVSDRVTAAKLQSMSMAYRKARCPTSPPTASPACEPKCQAGKCR